MHPRKKYKTHMFDVSFSLEQSEVCVETKSKQAARWYRQTDNLILYLYHNLHVHLGTESSLLTPRTY